MKNAQNVRSRIINFSDFFKEAGLNEEQFIVPETGTWAEKAAMQLKRLKVAEMVLNREKTPDMSDTSQWKYTPWFRIIKDAGALAVFRLSYGGCAYGSVSAYLGARPQFLTSADAEFLGVNFTSECELLLQYQAMANKELLESFRSK